MALKFYLKRRQAKINALNIQFKMLEIRMNPNKLTKFLENAISEMTQDEIEGVTRPITRREIESSG